MQSFKFWITIAFSIFIYSINYSQSFQWELDGYIDFSSGGTFNNIDSSGINLIISGLVEDDGLIMFTPSWADEGMQAFLKTGINDFGESEQHEYKFEFSEEVSVYFLISNIDIGVGWNDRLTFSGNPLLVADSLINVEGNTIYPIPVLGYTPGGTVRVTYNAVKDFTITHGTGSGYNPGYLLVSEIIFSPTTTHVNQHQNNIDFKMFPNPSTDILNIECNAKINSVNIISTDGTLLKTISEDKINSKIGIEELPKGLYYIQVYIEKGFITQKLIKL